MLDFSWSHILVLLIIALVVVGPKDLPRLMRIVGQWTGKARRMADEFRKSFDDMARQSELDDLRKEIENLRTERPLASIDQDLNRSIIPDDMKSTTPAPPAAAPPTAAPPPEPPAAPDPAIPEPVAADGYSPPKP